MFKYLSNHYSQKHEERYNGMRNTVGLFHDSKVRIHIISDTLFVKRKQI